MTSGTVLRCLWTLLVFSILNSLFAIVLLPVVDSAPQFTCRAPDFPSKGEYKVIKSYRRKGSKYNAKQSLNESENYLPGDKIVYSCTEGRSLVGNIKRYCTHSGEWTDSSPFCDEPLNIENALITEEEKTVLDRNPSTCKHLNSLWSDVFITLNKKVSLRAVKIYVITGAFEASIDVYITDRRKCGTIHIKKNSSQWFLLKCYGIKVLAEFVKVEMISLLSSVSLCEVEIFTKEGCDDPPDFDVANGHLEFDRKTATLFCDVGFKARSDRIVCENNTWIASTLECAACHPPDVPFGGEYSKIIDPATDGVSKQSLNESESYLPGDEIIFSCKEGLVLKGNRNRSCSFSGEWTGYTPFCDEETKISSNVTVIISVPVITSVAVMALIILFFLMGLAKYLIHKKRSRNPVVVYSVDTDRGNNDYSEMDYDGPGYETIRDAPTPPSSPRPPLPTAARNLGHLLSNDCSSSTSTKTSKNEKTSSEVDFRTLKSCAVYDN